MEPIFQTTTKITHDDYQDFVFAVLLGRRQMVLSTVFLMIAVSLAGVLLKNRLYFLLAFCVPFIVIWSIRCSGKRIYYSNKVLRDSQTEYTFFADELLIHTAGEQSQSDARIRYEQIYKIVESRRGIYLLIANNQGYLFPKRDCSEALLAFIRELRRFT